ncbi:MAG: ABC transporter ATP-binding protein [Clostridiales bacterium]|nr:ABC transporter ATP-binding protein [Clostridiales bacterium]
MALLEVKDLMVNYGQIKAIRGVSFEVNEGEIVALIGANGAGKTSIMHAINGLIPVREGSIKFQDVELTKYPSHKIVKLGLTQVPEGRRVFQELSVKDNLILGAYSRKDRNEIKESMERVFAKFPVLGERQSQVAGTLSGGEQQMLAVGRALMSKPTMLLLDEPSMGLSPLYVNKIFDTIKEINAEGTTVLLVEQNAKKALSIANRAYVLKTGTISLQGDAKELLQNDQVKKEYLAE